MFSRLTVIVSLCAAALLSTWVYAGAENAVTADPQHYTVEFENDRVRIIRIKYGPGEKSVMHSHGPNVSVLLTGGTMRMHAPDGSSEDIPFEPGSADFAENEEHMPENISDETVEVVLVELID